MPIKLNDPAKNVDIDSAEYRTMLGNLQANILKSHGRDFARHIFLQFTAAPSTVKAWIRDTVAPTVTTAAQQLAQIQDKREGRTGDGGTVRGFFLSATGYEHLGLDTDRFASGAFRKGMKQQDDPLLGGLLGGNNKDPKPSTWEAGFQQRIDALLTVADDDEDVTQRAAEEIRAGLAGVGQVLTIEEGLVLRRRNAAGADEPIEHFGYFDGISNPLFTRQDLEKDEQQHPENQARAHWDPGASLSLVLTDDPFTDQTDAFGSYLVYRKLGQNVRAFERQVGTLATALDSSGDLAGAMVVGRFKDGTPVLDSSTPNPGPDVLNDFHYRQDEDGLKCPAHAHIRKANPRGTTPLTSLDSERRRRIVRRGIPYGKPLPNDGTLTNPGLEAAPRGLLFMCFQQNIEDQFEFIQRTWVDNKNFPTGILFQRDTGDDPLIGQDRDEAQRWPKRWGDKEAGKKTFNFESAVTLKGGEYFFAPSLPFLRSL
jgi:Dyp-type peroxidase family